MPYDDDPFGEKPEEGPESPFTATGEMRLVSGLNKDGDPAWRSEYSGMNQMEMLGLLVATLVRHLLGVVSHTHDIDDEDPE